VTAARTRSRRAAGFTLVELVIAVALSGVFAAALFSFFESGTQASRTHERQARSQSDARVAMDRISRDVRQAVGYPLGIGVPLATLHTTELVLFVDNRRSSDPTLEPLPSRVRYALVGDELIREEAVPAVAGGGVTWGAYAGRTVLADHVVTGAGAPALFQGILTSGPMSGAVPAAQLGDVVQIRIRLALTHGVGPGSTSVSDEVTADVTLRNAR
jgi:prepilin-type N-terminal cleavage/methylation domain-containing protein